MNTAMLAGLGVLMACGSAAPDSAGSDTVTQVFAAVTPANAERALETNNISELKRMLDEGLDPNAMVAENRNLIDVAAYAPNVELVKLLHSRGATFEVEEESRRFGPLRRSLALAVETGYDANFEYILANVKDFSYRSGSPQFTLPESAVALGQDKIANRLLDMGYDRDLDDLLGYARRRSVTENSEASRDKAKLIARLEKRVKE